MIFHVAWSSGASLDTVWSKKMPFLSSRAKVILTAGVALGFSIYQLTCIAVADYADQAANSPRPLPSYNGGNPEGYNTARPFRDHGPPGWASVNSPIDPPLSDEEFRSHFGFAAHLILEVLDVLRLPATPGRLGPATFPYRFENGTPTRWIEPVHALLIFLKRLRTRGSTVIQMQSFLGRSVGYLSEVSNAVLSWINYKWIPLKIQSMDARVFDPYRIKDYADCLWRNGLRLPGCCGFVDGTFHKTYRPGADGYNGLLQRAFYSGDKKAHGLVFEMILFPDGMVGRAFGPVEGRRHDLYLARVSRLLALITHGALQGFRLFGDKAYIGFGANILHPFIGAAVGSIEAEWNEYTSGYRNEVEHVIGNIYSRWACLQHEQGIEMHLPEVWFQASVLMNNIHVCATRSSQTALRWAMPILPLRKYMEP